MQVIDFKFVVRPGAPMGCDEYSVMRDGALRVARICEIVERHDGTKQISGYIADDIWGVAELLPRATWLETI